MKKNTIVFILSSGHSGSTILDLALGAHENCFSLGEISEIQDEINKNTHCVCGEKILSCKFWVAVNNDLLKKHQKKISVGGGFLLCPPLDDKKSILLKITKFLKVIGLLKAKDDWVANADQLYSSIFEVSQKKVIIDSSKNIIRALLLKQALTKYDVKFLHLVRDVRGVAYSYNKKSYSVKLPGEEKKEVERTRDVFPIEKTCSMWSRYNGKIVLSLKAIIKHKNSIRIRYEDLCSKPDETLKEIVEWIGLEYSESLSKFSCSEHHNVGGNPSRFNSTEIKLMEEKWRSSLDVIESNRCVAKTRWLNKYFGYNK